MFFQLLRYGVTFRTVFVPQNEGKANRGIRDQATRQQGNQVIAENREEG
jgi:hypothetical protein